MLKLEPILKYFVNFKKIKIIKLYRRAKKHLAAELNTS